MQISPQTSKLEALISLYMPDTLTATYDASYDELSLLDLGDTITNLRMIDQIADTGKAQIKEHGLAKGLGNTISQDPAAISVLASVGGGLASNLGINATNVRDVLLKGKGYAINPQMQMIYRGMGFRSFQLAFTFTPRSRQEADNINRIIQELKMNFVPTLQKNKNSDESMFMVPPSIFNLKFMINDKENTYIPKYGDCVLVNIDVNYAPNGWAAYENGAPVQTQLTLQFKETEILDTGKLQKGFTNSPGGLR
jgi:hypothetical protein